jgi:hypothetical protein
MFLYLQSDKETIEQYGRNFCVFWDTVEAFRGYPRIHKGMIEALLKNPAQVAIVGSSTAAKRKKAKDNATESMKVALLISRVDKQIWKAQGQTGQQLFAGNRPKS